MNKIKVFTFFSYLNKDIYLINLYNSLKKLDIEAYDMRKPLMIFKSKIVHLHWIEYYIVSKSIFKTIFKLIFFPVLFLFLKHILRKKIIISLHNIESHEKYFPKIEKIGFKFYLSFLANRIIFFNNWQKTELIKRYNIKDSKLRKTDLISFIDSYPNTISKKEARKKLSINQNKLVLLVLGRLEEYKGIYDLIAFLKKEKNRDYVVIFAGKPGTEDIKNKLLALEKEQKNNLVLKPDYFSDKDIQMYMNASDIGLLSQKWLTNSGVLLLFGAFKKPMIAKHSVAFKEILGNNAFYYKNDKELKKIIKNLKLKNLKKNGEEFYEKIKNITWKNIAKDTLKIYEETLK